MTETLIPGYDIISVLGRGETATVYHAVFSGRQPVALKVLDSRLSSDPDFITYFRGDLKSAASLDHPNIGRVYACGSTGTAPYIAAELVEGESLRAILRRRLPSLEEAARVLEGVGSALDFAHEQRMLHRDVQPGNILLRENGSVVLVDFGLARCTRLAALTSANLSLRRAPYVAPEVCQGMEPDYRSDLYSLGIVAFEMLAGRPPFDGPEPLAIYGQHIKRAPQSITELKPSLPRRVQRVLERALAKDPDRRYQSGRELAREFAAACGLPTAEEPAAPKVDLKPLGEATAGAGRKVAGGVAAAGQATVAGSKALASGLGSAAAVGGRGAARAGSALGRATAAALEAIGRGTVAGASAVGTGLERAASATSSAYTQWQTQAREKAEFRRLEREREAEERRKEQERLAAEKARQEEEQRRERERQEAEKAREAEESRREQEHLKAEQERLAELRRQEEARRRAEEAEKRRLEEEAREAELERIKAEEARLREERRLAEEKRKAEEAERKRLEAEARKAERERLRAEQARLREEQRQAEDKRRAEEAARKRQEEEKRRRAEQERIKAEQERRAEEVEKQRLEAEREAEEARQREQQRLKEEKRRADEADERRRDVEARQARLREEQRLAEEQRRVQEAEKRRRDQEREERLRRREQGRQAELRREEETRSAEERRQREADRDRELARAEPSKPKSGAGAKSRQPDADEIRERERKVLFGAGPLTPAPDVPVKREKASRAKPAPSAAESGGRVSPLPVGVAVLAVSAFGAMVYLNQPNRGAGAQPAALPPPAVSASAPAPAPGALRERLSGYLDRFEAFHKDRLKLPRAERRSALDEMYRELRGLLQEAGRLEARERPLESEIYRELGTVEWYRASPDAARHHWRKALQLNQANKLAAAWLAETKGAVLNE